MNPPSVRKLSPVAVPSDVEPFEVEPTTRGRDKGADAFEQGGPRWSSFAGDAPISDNAAGAPAGPLATDVASRTLRARTVTPPTPSRPKPTATPKMARAPASTLGGDARSAELSLRLASALALSQEAVTADPSTQAVDTDERIQRGDRGPGVRSIQRELNRHGYPVGRDGVFGAGTERVLRDFQRDHNLPVTGVADDSTRAALHGPKALRRGARGEAVKNVQERLQRHGLDIEVDARFGPATEQAVRTFQQDNGLRATGIVDARTRLELERWPELRLTDPSTWLPGAGRAASDFGSWAAGLWKDGEEFVGDVSTLLNEGWGAFWEKKKSDIEPVLKALDRDLEDPIRQLRPGDEFTFDNRGIFRGGGASDVFPLLGLVGARGAAEVQVKVRREDDGSYTVRRQKLTLRTYSGEIDLDKMGKKKKTGSGEDEKKSGPFGVTSKAEIGNERISIDEFRFESPEDAARAARLLNRDGIADFFEPIENMSDADRAWVEAHRTARERGNQGHSRLALEGKAWILRAEGRGELNPGETIRYEGSTQPGRLIKTGYRWVELTGKEAVQMGWRIAKGTGGNLPDLVLLRVEEQQIYEVDEAPPPDATYEEMKALVPDTLPSQVVLRKRSWSGEKLDDWFEGQPDRVFIDETLTFEEPERTYFPQRSRIRWSDYPDVLDFTEARYRRTESRPNVERVALAEPGPDNTDRGESVRAELSGSPFGILYYSFRYEGQAVISDRQVTDSYERSSVP